MKNLRGQKKVLFFLIKIINTFKVEHELMGKSVRKRTAETGIPRIDFGDSVRGNAFCQRKHSFVRLVACDVKLSPIFSWKSFSLVIKR